MNWLNIKLVTLRSPEYIGSDPVSRATWWNVVVYCAEQENGGKIVGAKLWKDRQWQQTCGVMIEEVSGAGKLLTWEGDDLKVWNYPTEKEAEIKVKREGGKVGGYRSGEARTNHTTEEAPSSPSSSPSTIANNSARTEGEGKEKENSKKKGKVAASRNGVPEIPVELNSAEFLTAWDNYIAYRKKRGISPLLPESVAGQWKKMKVWGMEASIAQIEDTISQGWQGIFAPKTSNGKPFVPKPPPRPIGIYEAPRNGL